MTGGASVRVVTFDAGRTLLRATPSFWEAFCEGLEGAGGCLPEGVAADGESAVRELWERHDSAWRDAGRPSPHIGDPEAERGYWIELYRRMLEHFAVEGDRAALARAVAAHFASPGVFRPFDDVHGALDRLAGRGCRLALLSNWGTSLRGILAAEGLLDCFEAVVISGELGVAKPSADIYHRLLDQLGEQPGPQVAYVGDSIDHDVRPSRRLGLTPVLIDRAGHHPDHGGARITGLAGLEDVLALPG